MDPRLELLLNEHLVILVEIILWIIKNLENPFYGNCQIGNIGPQMVQSCLPDSAAGSQHPVEAVWRVPDAEAGS